MRRYVIICGGRNHPQFTSRQRDWLDELHRVEPFAEVIIGSAYGADDEGQAWARNRGIDCVTFWANWTAHGKSAGPRRNTRMLIYVMAQAMIRYGDRPLVIAFPGGKGTLDMCTQARRGNIEVKTWDAFAGGLYEE